MAIETLQAVERMSVGPFFKWRSDRRYLVNV
jgi:hypothetical protein